MPGHQHLTDEQTEHVRYGYFETHGQHISDHHLANLNKDQLRYYYAQANYYATLEQLDEVAGKRRTLVIWIVVLICLLLSALSGAGTYAYYKFYKPETVNATDHSGEGNYSGSTTNAGD